MFSGLPPLHAAQRRPTGTPPPLPHPFRVSTTAWLMLAAAIVACIFLFSAHTQWLGLDDRANTGFLRLLAKVRTPWLTDVAGVIKAAAAGGVTALGLVVVALIMIFRRWRHLRRTRLRKSSAGCCRLPTDRPIFDSASFRADSVPLSRRSQSRSVIAVLEGRDLERDEQARPWC